MVLASIKIFGITQAIILAFYFIDFELYINLQVAFLSSFFIILATNYTHKKMVAKKVQSGIYEDQRDTLDKIDDPYELFEEDDINDAPFEELDVRQIIKDEKSKVKILSSANIRQGLKGSFSFLRLGGYVFLILGFIALKNNGVLNIAYYLPSLLVGIIVGGIISKRMAKD
jgi:hypothetical protein